MNIFFNPKFAIISKIVKRILPKAAEGGVNPASNNKLWYSGPLGRFCKSKIWVKHSVTLVELLTAVALIGLLIIGITNLYTFAHSNLMNSDRGAQVKNDASYVLEHMAKHLGQAIGGADANLVGVIEHPIEEWIKVRWDRDSDGQPDDNNPGDWIAYRYIPAAGQIQYHVTCDPAGWPAGGGEVLSGKITSLNFNYVAGENYISVDITSRWNPAQAVSLDNPEVIMRTRINMPAVSVN